MPFEKYDSRLQPVEFDPFAGPEIQRVAPSIEPQLEIWASCMIGGEDANRAFNESISLNLSGRFDFSAMEIALHQLVERHEALRSTFSSDGSQIFIYKYFPFQWIIEDLSALDPEKQRGYITEYSTRDQKKAFDLLKGPLFRVALFKLKDEEQVLNITAHHIICDGWSLGILLQDLGKLYSAIVRGIIPELPDPVRFSQYAVDYWKLSESEEYKKTEEYWTSQFKNDIPILNMPIDGPRPPLRSYVSRREDIEMPQDLIAAVKKMGAKAGCSFVTTLLSSFEVLIYRITGQQDIILGLPASGQSITGNYSLIGHCVHLLPLRSHLDAEIPFAEYLKKRKSQMLNDFDHQQFTFGSLLKKLNIPRDPSRIPLVPIAFNIDMGLDDGVAFTNLKYQLSYNPRAYENFEIFLNATGSEKSLMLEWSYNTQLFKSASIHNMMQGFLELLSAVVKDPDISLKEISIPALQRNRNQDGEFNFPTKTIAALFSEQAARTPDRPALAFENSTLTYHELDEKSNQLAHFLKKRGVDVETLVPICVERSAKNIIGILAILKAGGAYVPIDPEYPQERINLMIDDCKSQIIISSLASKNKIRPDKNRALIVLEKSWEEINRESKIAPKLETLPDNLAYVMYTSGSTGRPKGVMIENKNVVSLVSDVDYVQLNPDDALLSTGSPSFDATTFEYWGMLLNGGLLDICSEQTLLNADLLKREIRKRKITIAWFTSSLLNQWIDLDITVFEGLNTILAGGEKLSEKHIEKLRKTFPSIQLINGYGPTENTTFSLTYPITETEIDRAIPIGRPLNNRTAWVLNPAMEICPDGVSGELYVGGAGVGRGYLNQEALTRERFIPDPFSKIPNSKLYRTGDLASKYPGGNIDYQGRIDEQVKIRGFRIEPGEIESVLRQLNVVKQAVVIAREDKEGEKRLVAYIVAKELFNKETIISHLQSKLPDYMIPRALVQLERIPLTSNGKVDKKALPDPDLLIHYAGKKEKLPHTEGQKLVAGIWAEALGLEKVNIDDNFFELGGHSLVAVKVMRRLEEKTGRHLPITSLFESPTVEKLTSLLDLDDRAISWKSLVAIKPEGTRPPLYIVHGSGLTVLVFSNLAKGMDPEQPVYGLQARGLNGEEPFDKMEDIAAYYISEILSQNPDGPFCLAGYSFGGIVAFEMAKQLTAMGKEIKMLAIFDTNADNSDYYLPTKDRVSRKIRRQFPKMLFVMKSFRSYPKQTIMYQARFFKNKLRSLLEKTGLLARKQSEEEQLTIHADRIHQAHHTAFCNYRMAPYNGIVHLFRVSKRLYFVDDPEFLGWKPYALKGIRIHNIPGDHRTFLLPPNDKELAKILRDTLRECQTLLETEREHSLKPTALIRV